MVGVLNTLQLLYPGKETWYKFTKAGWGPGLVGICVENLTHLSLRQWTKEKSFGIL